VFQRDRDRILHAPSFRRLKHKTQVFIAPLGDHYRTRLTHVLEVSQIGRTIARALRLNEDLVEAIAMGHDLGHGPFGHAGENAIAQAMGVPYRHNAQSLRVVDVLEKEGHGLNLTAEVRDGILNHSKPRAGVLADGGPGWPTTLEGQIMRLADAIAYINHDIDDAIRAQLITVGDLPAEAVEMLGRSHAERINTMVADCIETNWWATGEDGAAAVDGGITLSEPVLLAADALRDFMFGRVYGGPEVMPERERAERVVFALWRYYEKRPEVLPADVQAIAQRDGVSIALRDHIAGMTDLYALRCFDDIHHPHFWA
jgi:dGTPase